MSFLKEFRTEIKTLLVVAVVAIIIVVGAILLLREATSEPVAQTAPFASPSPQLQQFIPGQEFTIQGSVVENRKGCMADASCSLYIRINKKEIKVVYDWGGEAQPCTNRASKQGLLIEEGNEVEVFAKAVSENKVSTCDSSEYYIKQIEPDSNIATSTWQTYRNEEFGFEFEYPSAGWEISVVHPGHTDFVGPDEEKNIIIDIIAMEEGKTIESIMFRRLACAGDFCEPRTGSPPADFSSRIPLGEHSFFFTSVSSYQSAGPHIVYYYLLDSKNNRLIAFRLTLAKGYGATPYYEYGLEEEPNYNTLNQILSTFRFIE